jgi:hypothetical protein
VPQRAVAGVVEAAVAEVEGRDTGTGWVLGRVMGMGAAVEEQHEQGRSPDPDPLLSGHQPWERRRGARL